MSAKNGRDENGDETVEAALRAKVRKMASAARAAILAPGGRAPQPFSLEALSGTEMHLGIRLSKDQDGSLLAQAWWADDVRDPVVLGRPGEDGVLEVGLTKRKELDRMLSDLEGESVREVLNSVRRTLDALMREGVPVSALTAEVKAACVRSVMQD